MRGRNSCRTMITISDLIMTQSVGPVADFNRLYSIAALLIGVIARLPRRDSFKKRQCSLLKHNL